MITIKDIARSSNVSTATVSRILNNDPSLSVSDETRKRVLAVVSELNYKPLRRKNVKAKKQEEAYNIGVIMLNDETIDPYFQSIRLGAENACNQYPLSIISTMIVGKSQITAESLSGLDGLIVIGDVDITDLKELYYENNNIVAVDYLPKDSNVDVVISDFEGATEQVLEYLVQLGHTDIAYIGGRGAIYGVSRFKTSDKEDTRKSTFEKCMKEKGLYNQDHVLIGDWGTTSGYTLTKQLIEMNPLPSAIVVGSDPTAMGVLRALHEADIKVPEDISIFSYDDIEAAAYMNPPLSTVKVYGDEMGKTAIKLLYDRLKGRTVPLKVILPAELVIRDSVKSKEC